LPGVPLECLDTEVSFVAQPMRSVELLIPRRNLQRRPQLAVPKQRGSVGRGYDAKLGFTFERARIGLSDLDAADRLPVSLTLRTR
jgi:hypothetical protein